MDIMKALSQFSAFVLVLVAVMMMMMMAMMVQASELFGDANADPDIPPKEDNGTLYYIREDSFTDIETAIKNCEADSGKLVEIWSESEFDFVDEYLKSVTDQGARIDLIYIGAQYQLDDSQWIFPHDRLPLSFFHPSSSLANFDPSWGDFCLALQYESETGRYSMQPASCTTEGVSTMRYMCEKMYALYYYPTQLPNADPDLRVAEFRKKIYYFHKNRFSNYDDNSEDCKADGGMVAEINDWHEFQVVHKYVESTVTDYSRVYIGGKKSSNGWVLPSTNQSLPYAEWGLNEPLVYRTFYNCLTLDMLNGWRMASFFCDNAYITLPYRVLCEKPKDS